MPAPHLPLTTSPPAVGADFAPDAALVAVLAHGLLGGLSVLRTAVHTLANTGVPDEKRADIVSLADAQLEMMADTLRSLAMGLPAIALDYLDELAAERAATPGGEQPLD